MRVSSVDIGVLASVCYFLGFGVVFLALPSTVETLGLKWIDQAGKTEVRCYYGALSVALGGFLIYMLDIGHQGQALILVIFLASAVFVVRAGFLFVDHGVGLAYNKLAVPVELGFVVFLVITRLATFSVRL